MLVDSALSIKKIKECTNKLCRRNASPKYVNNQDPEYPNFNLSQSKKLVSSHIDENEQNQSAWECDRRSSVRGVCSKNVV